MIHFNLQPWREQQRDTLKKNYLRLFVVVLILVIVVLVSVHLILSRQVSAQQARVSYLQQQSQVYQREIVQIGQQQRLKTDIHERLKVIKSLQHNRAMVPNLFQSFVNIAPDGIYFTAINRNANQLEIFGKADSNAQVSQLMRNVKASSWLNDAKLRVIKLDDSNQYKRLFELQVMDKALQVTTPPESKK